MMPEVSGPWLRRAIDMLAVRWVGGEVVQEDC